MSASANPNVNLSIFERAPSTVSLNPPKSTEELQNDYLNKIRQQTYVNITKTENTFNSGILGSINTLQDSEMNEVINGIENFMKMTIRSIDKNDHIINMATNLESDSQSLGKSSTKKTDNSSDLKNFIEPSISIQSLVQIDLLRNGLKSGPLLLQKDTTETVENAKTNSKTLKPNLDIIPTLSNQLNYKLLIGNKNKIIFKYFFVLDLNTFYFQFCKLNKKQPLYAIKLANIPADWTNSDLEQLTLEININEPTKKVEIPYIRKQPAPNYLPRRHFTRFLNSRALFDRVYRHFVRVLFYEWNVGGDEKTGDHKESQKYFEKERTCDLKDNKLKIVLRFKGIKHKDLEVVLLVDLVIRMQELSIQKHLIHSMVNISNDFFQNGGVFTSVPLITPETMKFIINWLKNHLNCDLETMYLLPNCVHYWTLNVQSIKQNFLRFLCWVNNFSDKSAESIIIVNVLSGFDNSTPAQLRTFFASQLHRQTNNYTFSQILTNCNQSCLYLITKQLQLFNYLSLSKKELCEKVGNYSQSEDTLLPDIVFSEICHNAVNAARTWTTLNVFDLFWSMIMRVRCCILQCLVKDNFAIHDNVLPNEYIQFIGVQSFDIIPYLNHRQNTMISSNDFFITKKQLEDNEVNKYVEAAMKLILTGITPDEKEKEIGPVPVRSQTNMSELSENRLYKKPVNMSYLATLGGSDRDTSRSDYLNETKNESRQGHVHSQLSDMNSTSMNT